VAVRPPDGDDAEVKHTYEVREVLPDGTVTLWATTSVGNESSRMRDTMADWRAATFVDFGEVDPALNAELRATAAKAFLRAGKLSEARLDDAKAAFTFEAGTSPSRTRILRANLPLGQGHPEWEWDGTPEEARELAIEIATNAGENVCDERAQFGETGWEAAPDD